MYLLREGGMGLLSCVFGRFNVIRFLRFFIDLGIVLLKKLLLRLSFFSLV